jgi:hypothetical protein
LLRIKKVKIKIIFFFFFFFLMNKIFYKTNKPITTLQ